MPLRANVSTPIPTADPTPRLLIVRVGALGDTLLTAPVLHALRGRHPGVRITAVGNRTNWETLGTLVDRCLSIESPPLAGLLGGIPSQAALDLVKAHDLTIIWSARSPHPSMLESVARIVHASPYPPPGVHAARWLAETVGLTLGSLPTPLIPLSEKERADALIRMEDMNVRDPVVVHPGGGAPWKRWPADRFAALIQSLQRQGTDVVLLEGPADERAVAEVRAVLDQPVPILRDLPLRSLTALVREARVYLGNDSGITHLAAMSGARTIALFGPTDPGNWAPLGDVRVVRACGTRTCYQGQIRVCEDPGCMDAIPVADALAAISP